jgi:hypothetical protein
MPVVKLFCFRDLQNVHINQECLSLASFRCYTQVGSLITNTLLYIFYCRNLEMISLSVRPWQAGKACQGQTLYRVTNICYLC